MSLRTDPLVVAAWPTLLGVVLIGLDYVSGQSGLLPFSSELLLVGMAGVGVLTAALRSDNPYLSFAIVATLLGLIRAVVIGSIFVPMIYFVVIGAGFMLGSFVFGRRQA